MASAGSSPLARGLPADDAKAVAKGRIIPARAGFTSTPSGAALYGQDHPRSRGVYPFAMTPAWKRTGSSPLARGLPSHLRVGGAPFGIIPARAGFTPGCRYRGWHVEDHPRSRGVYDGKVSADAMGTGSSPLARGLRPAAALTALGLRIIPARAGFTVLSIRLTVRRRDHPRSRGVYSSFGVTITVDAGSSPLARGLPHIQLQSELRGRIIPARAGFTERVC